MKLLPNWWGTNRPPRYPEFNVTEPPPDLRRQVWWIEPNESRRPQELCRVEDRPVWSVGWFTLCRQDSRLPQGFEVYVNGSKIVSANPLPIDWPYCGRIYCITRGVKDIVGAGTLITQSIYDAVLNAFDATLTRMDQVTYETTIGPFVRESPDDISGIFSHKPAIEIIAEFETVATQYGVLNYTAFMKRLPDFDRRLYALPEKHRELFEDAAGVYEIPPVLYLGDGDIRLAPHIAAACGAGFHILDEYVETVDLNDEHDALRQWFMQGLKYANVYEEIAAHNKVWIGFLAPSKFDLAPALFRLSWSSEKSIGYTLWLDPISPMVSQLCGILTYQDSFKYLPYTITQLARHPLASKVDWRLLVDDVVRLKETYNSLSRADEVRNQAEDKALASELRVHEAERRLSEADRAARDAKQDADEADRKRAEAEQAAREAKQRANEARQKEAEAAQWARTAELRATEAKYTEAESAQLASDTRQDASIATRKAAEAVRLQHEAERRLSEAELHVIEAKQRADKAVQNEHLAKRRNRKLIKERDEANQRARDAKQELVEVMKRVIIALGTQMTPAIRQPSAQDWPAWSPYDQIGLARYVQDDVKCVTHLVDEILSEKAKGRGEIDVRVLIESVYEKLVSLNIMCSHEPLCLGKPQVIRRPDEILSSSRMVRHACCLDLSVLICDCILDGLQDSLRGPLIFIFRDRKSGDQHAVPGAWLHEYSDADRAPIYDDARRFRTSGHGQNVVMVEATGVTRNPRTSREFDDAVAEAPSLFESPDLEFCYAVDVLEARTHGIEPFPA